MEVLVLVRIFESPNGSRFGNTSLFELGASSVCFRFEAGDTRDVRTHTDTHTHNFVQLGSRSLGV